MFLQGSIHRFELMDVGRGFAILGILWLNIFIFAMPYEAMVIPEIWGEANTVNFAVWACVNIGIDGVMRGMISIVFGATALMLLRRVDNPTSDPMALDHFFRRLLWLILFGVIHSYFLLWPYDILYAYGVLGLLIFPFRNLGTRPLLVIGCVMLVASALFSGFNENDIQEAQAAVEELLSDDDIDALRNDEPLIENYDEYSGQRDELESGGLTDLTSNETEFQEESAYLEDLETLYTLIDIDISRHQLGYIANFLSQTGQSFDQQTAAMLKHHLWDVATFFVFGMILFKNGFLTTNWSLRSYVMVTVLGYAVGMFFGIAANLPLDESVLLEPIVTVLSQYTYDLRRLCLALANFSFLAIVLKLGTLAFLTKSLASCGRMALSLYIWQTLVCNFLFLGFGLYGQLEHFEIAIIAAAMTLIQLVLTPIYLDRFSQGPLEWLLRLLIRMNSSKKGDSSASTKSRFPTVGNIN